MMDSKETIGSIIMGSICIFFVVAVLGIMGYISLAEHEHMIKEGAGLPNGATNIEEVGSGWVEFTYKNQRFLYRKYSFSDRKSECIVKINND